MHEFEQRIPGLSRGDGTFAYEFGGFESVTGQAPSRDRTDFNPLNRKEYLARLSQGHVG